MQRKIMIVDDEAATRTLLNIILQRQGFSILEAKTPQNALAQLNATTPDLFILDVMMPNIDGIELCRQLRSRAETARTPVIMLSANYDPSTIATGLAAGATEYLTKPIMHYELIMKINEIFGC